MKTVRDMMVTNVVTVSGDCGITDAVMTMKDHEIGAVVVVEEKRPIGIFTERDLLNKVSPVLDSGILKSLTVKEVMTRDLVTAGPETPCTECLKLMWSHKIRHLPVVEGDAIIGIVSIRDVVVNYAEDMEMITANLLMTSIPKVQYDAVINSLREGFFLIDVDGNVIRINEKAKALTGHGDELIGRPASALFRDERFFRDKVVRGCVDSGNICFDTVDLKKKGGKAVSTCFTCAAMKNEDGNIIGFACSAWDVKDLKKLAGAKATKKRK